MKKMEIAINEEKGEISISFNEKFYDLKSIKYSLLDYKDVCKWKLLKNQDKKIIRVILYPKEKGFTNLIGYEFCNYLLALMKYKSLV